MNSARMASPQIVGLLACQIDSYMSVLRTKVSSCRPTPNKEHEYQVEFQDTIMFPEGGGQPHDIGAILLDGGDRILVNNVQRDGLRAIHYLNEPLDEGTEIEMQLDWPRRWDHMQQHTGQHLLSAILDKRKIPTLGWSLGRKTSYIELPRKLTMEEINDVQEKVNQKIRDAVNIFVEKSSEFQGDHKVPDSYDLDKGVIRIIHIGDLDANPCCGTHLKTTAHIGSLALLHSQNIRGTNSRLFFIAGDRVTAFASESNEILRNAASLLSCQTEEIGNKLTKLSEQLKESNTRQRKLEEQLATHEAQSLKQQLETKKIASLYKQDGDFSYLKMIEKKLDKNLTGAILYYTGKPGGPGAIVVSGQETESLIHQIKEIIPDIKGGGKGKWQGKVSSWNFEMLEKMKKLSI